MSTHNLCFEQKYEKYHSFLSENFKYLEEKFSVYLNRRVFVMFLYVPTKYNENNPKYTIFHLITTHTL